MLATGLHMLAAVADEKEVDRVVPWEDMKELWDEYRTELEKLKDRFDLLVPVELLVPSPSGD